MLEHPATTHCLTVLQHDRSTEEPTLAQLPCDVTMHTAPKPEDTDRMRKCARRTIYILAKNVG